MTLYLVGMGIYDMADVTIRGLEAIRNSDVIYLEHYTAILHTKKEELEDIVAETRKESIHKTVSINKEKT